MAIRCPKCEAENTSDSQFCKKCATPLPSSKEISVSQTETLRTPIKELTAGSTFAGRYQVIEELGKGGMGRVYKVFDTKIKEKVALKLIKPEVASDKETIERFSNELRLARQISHRNVCRMYDLGESEGAHYITMEYVHGEDLKSMIRMSRTMSIGAVLGIGKQVCDGLAEAHSLGVVHRDLKPQNIMIDKGGNAKIMDFGIARSTREKGITGPSVLIGTPEYMSPEQAEAKELDHRSDIYSLGIILYEMATGRVPFEGDTALSIAMKHKGEIPKNPKQVNPNIPDDLSAVILKSLEKDKVKRYQTAGELRTELDKIEKGIPTAERIVPERKTLTSREITVKFNLKKLFWPGLSIVVIAVLAIVFWRTFVTKKAPPAAQKSQARMAGLAESKTSIAVLPFKNLSGEKDQEYFCDGVTDDLITKLSNISSLRVISRNSVFMYKSNPKISKSIADELQVRNILDGSIRKAGNKLRINMQLIDVGTDAPIWSQIYDKNLDDFLDVEDAIAQAIARALKLKMTPEENQRMSARAIDNASAHDFYLRAEAEIYRFTDDALGRALQNLQKGIEIIGDNALFYAAIGAVYWQYVNIGVRQEGGIAMAEEYANKALALDPDLPQAHMTLGLISRDFRGNLNEAVRHFKKALAVNPNESTTLMMLAYTYILDAGKPGLALPLMERFRKVDPLNVFNYGVFGTKDLMDGQYDSALDQFQKCYEIAPANPVSVCFYAMALAHQKETDKAFSIIEKIARVAPDNTFTKFVLLMKYGFLKDKEKAFREMTPDFEKTCKRDMEASYWVAVMLSLLDAKKEALDWLENANHQGFINYPALKREPFLQNIRGEERFKKLMERAKYEWEHFEE